MYTRNVELLSVSRIRISWKSLHPCILDQGPRRFSNQTPIDVMAAREHSEGTCTYCGDTYKKSGMVRHLRACVDRKAALQNASGSSETLYHVRVDEAHGAFFWLDLEVRGSATLDDLDDYLRSIWLECCGHMSRFGGWGHDELPKSARVDEIFETDFAVEHIYDFGSSTHTQLRVMDTREGAATTKHPVALMARNDAPDVQCSKCEKQANWLCVECMYESDEAPELCDEHADSHPHEGYGPPLPIVNSPRVGVCGYEGPAEPPY